MATYTTNYNLKKPAYTDIVDVADLNSNADTIDSTMATIANGLALGGIDSDAWMYTNFRNQLTRQEITDIEANPSLMSIIDGSAITKISKFWRLIQTYDVAGTYNWVAPDLNLGKDYVVGVFMIGGGGGGGAMCDGFSAYYSCVSGGGSGFSKNVMQTVTPNTSYPVVVGAGGQGTAVTENGTTVGETGGTTSFNGISVRGGSGGNGSKSQYETSCGANSGGQPSDYIHFNSRFPIPSTVGGCTVAVHSAYSLGNQDNIFEPGKKAYLACGAGANPNYVGTGGIVSDGKGGDAVKSNTANVNVTGGNATGYGNGGGGAYHQASKTTATVKGGSGSGGLVLIYALGV